MKMKSTNSKFFSLLLCMMLTVAMAFCTTGCSGKTDAEAPANDVAASEEVSQAEETVENAQAEDADASTQTSDTQDETKDQQTEESADEAEVTVLGEGQVTFTFCVTDAQGNETNFEIHTDKETVGDALLEHALIAGDEGEYGLYVKTVNGITADYDVDQTYWAFYVNGEYAQTGVDATAVKDGDAYAFKVEK